MVHCYADFKFTPLKTAKAMFTAHDIGQKADFRCQEENTVLFVFDNDGNLELEQEKSRD